MKEQSISEIIVIICMVVKCVTKTSSKRLKVKHSKTFTELSVLVLRQKLFGNAASTYGVSTFQASHSSFLLLGVFHNVVQ